MHFEINPIKVGVAEPVARRKQNNAARATDSTADNTTYTHGWVCFGRSKQCTTKK